MLLSEIKAQLIFFREYGDFGPFIDPRSLWNWNRRYYLIHPDIRWERANGSLLYHLTCYTGLYLYEFSDFEEKNVNLKLSVTLEFAKCDLFRIQTN